jgi:hypothetical protein
MSELVAKVLEMTRLESGAIALQRDWAALNEIAGSVLRRLEERLAAHMVMIDLPAELPLVRVDSVLMEQVLANLLENAAKHTPPRTLIRLRAQASEPGDDRFGRGLRSGTPRGRARACLRQVRARGRMGQRPRRNGPGPLDLPGDRATATAAPSGPSPFPGAARQFASPCRSSPCLKCPAGDCALANG